MKFLNMKVLAVTLFALVGMVAPRTIEIDNIVELEDITAYGYLERVGIPLAEKIRQAEAEQQQSTRIIGGSAATLGQFPYQAGIIADLPIGQAACGGSLLNAMRVVTAAHCWWDGYNQASSFTIVLGSINLFTGGERFVTSTVYSHGGWNPYQVRYNVAVARLQTSVGFTNAIAPIALPSGGELANTFDGTTATASGFGATQENGAVSGILNYVDLPVIGNSECASTYQGYIMWNTICTSSAGGSSTCSGDAGGPLVAWSNNRNILIGIYSFSHSDGCARGHPAVYSRATSFAGWINSQLN